MQHMSYKHSCTFKYKLTSIHAEEYVYMHTHAYMHTYNAYICTRLQTICTRLQKNLFVCTHIFTHNTVRYATCGKPNTHTHTHTYIYTYTHTHTQYLQVCNMQHRPATISYQHRAEDSARGPACVGMANPCGFQSREYAFQCICMYVCYIFEQTHFHTEDSARMHTSVSMANPCGFQSREYAFH
jgi:hypothetical protein